MALLKHRILEGPGPLKVAPPLKGSLTIGVVIIQIFEVIDFAHVSYGIYSDQLHFESLQFGAFVAMAVHGLCGAPLFCSTCALQSASVDLTRSSSERAKFADLAKELATVFFHLKNLAIMKDVLREFKVSFSQTIQSRTCNLVTMQWSM